MPPKNRAANSPGMPGADGLRESGGLRRPLNAGLLNVALVAPGRLWTSIEVTARTGSTNADLVARAAAAGEAGRHEGLVLVAEEQTAGRGRLGRSWVSPPGAALTFSVLLRPAGIPEGQRGWLPLLAGIAVTDAVRAAAGLDTRLKWPNDVLAGSGKLAGVLAEAIGDAVVVGIGLNVSTSAAELPATSAGLRPTSLLIEGASGLARELLLIEILKALERRYLALRADPRGELAALRDEYRALSATLGRQVRVELPGGVTLAGEAADIDSDGRLVLVEQSAPEGAVPAGVASPSPRAIAAGDVIHVR